MTVSQDFMVSGGCELAVMSTSTSLSVAAEYAVGTDAKVPLLFRIKVNSPMDMGADVSWLSAFPQEAEVIYPPLSFMQPEFQQKSYHIISSESWNPAGTLSQSYQNSGNLSNTCLLHTIAPYAACKPLWLRFGPCANIAGDTAAM